MTKTKKEKKPMSQIELWRYTIRHLSDIRYDVQDVRTRSFNRLRQIGEVKGVNPKILLELENQIRDYIEAEIKDVPIYTKFLKPIKGIGPILSGNIIGSLDPHKAPHASSFWKYCGLHVNQERAVRRVKGEKLGFPSRMRVFAWKLGDSMIKQRTPFYRDIYDETKAKFNEKLNNPLENPKNCPRYDECLELLRKKAKRLGREAKKLPCKKHLHAHGRRVMVKRFLADLWGAWRGLEGLPVSEPYAVGILGHQKTEPSGVRNPYENSAPCCIRKPGLASENDAATDQEEENKPYDDRNPAVVSDDAHSELVGNRPPSKRRV